MHETRFINEIFIVLRDKLAKEKATQRVIVNVRLSPFSHVAAHSLQGSFKELIKGESFKNVRLKILPLEILLECKNCKRSTRITKRVFGCPFCHSADVNIQMDKEFFVESIEIKRKEKE
ncbi:MAG: hydrogenase maturation nickel metallochaperone HypA [Candidatus Omnitrophota bacterium]|jgi:Zn finger protein HypA/HybF involved in hydrogenase expression|nr:hydrogenase maturation nickel metallochaperone HypA [Candidatus Omnitrophota bacterium]